MSEELVPKQEPRVITIWNQRDKSKQEVTTDVKTWGEFIEQNQRDVNFKNMRGVIRETNNVLEVNDALLPEQGFTLFLFPKKVRSGEEGARTKEEYEKTFNRDELRKKASKRGLGSSGTKGDLAEKLAEDDRNKLNKKAPVEKKPIIHKATSNKQVARRLPSSVQFPAIIEKGTVSVSMELRITDVNALGSLLEVQFPHAEVVSVDAIISLKAELSLMPTKVEEVTEEVEEVEEVPAKPAPVKPPKKSITKKPTVKKTSDGLPPPKRGVKAGHSSMDNQKPVKDSDLAKEADDLAKKFM